jgi:hypothetical protein
MYFLVIDVYVHEQPQSEDPTRMEEPIKEQLTGIQVLMQGGQFQ